MRLTLKIFTYLIFIAQIFSKPESGGGVLNDTWRSENNSKYEKEGNITRVTEKRVFFIIDGTTDETFRIKKNVRRIPPVSDATQ